MKKKQMLFITISIIIAVILLYRLLFSYTIFRVNTRATSENIVGEKFTEINFINPLKSKSIKTSIENSLKYISETNDTSLTHKFIKSDIDINSGFKLLDIYIKDEFIYAFTDFKLKKESSFYIQHPTPQGTTEIIDNFKLLFLLSEDEKKVSEIIF